MSGFRGGFGGGFNMQNLMKQAQKMQEEMSKAKEEIESTEFRSSVGGGAVEVVMLGNKTVKSVKIKPEIIDPDDVEMLEDLIVAGVNDAVKQITEKENANMPTNLGGLC